MATSAEELGPALGAETSIRDPRPAQLCMLTALLTYGGLALDFVRSPVAVPLALVTAWMTETVLSEFDPPSPRAPARASSRARWAKLLVSGRRPSALISAVSALLLFRSEAAWPYAVVVAFAVASKRVFRFRGRHFVNPTNGAVVLGSLFLPGWIASGQWGHGLLLAFVLASGGLVVLTRAARLDTALAFLGGTATLLALRNLIIGYPWATLGHSFTSGTLWLFALYMMTDPKTTPRLRGARVVHGLWVALLAIALRQAFYVRDAFLWALFASAPLVPLLDLLTTTNSKGDPR